jgi:hypothetical protein
MEDGQPRRIEPGAECCVKWREIHRALKYSGRFPRHLDLIADKAFQDGGKNSIENARRERPST